ncbi:MAG: hypothetical protein KKF41_07420 [Actinobacteria bacterium]|nr:hypothetical protein [Actinomycetota bacterium]MBU1942252.1 hypothetical protein [Actinomycetota bacterium]MBU2687399.1 hypothetical protein [Actinomycetota bacterium]
MGSQVKKMKPKKNAEGEERRLALIAGALVVCLAVVLAVFLLVSGGDSKKPIKRLSAQTSPAGSTAPGASAPTTVPKVDISQVEVPPLSIYRRRNPFRPLVQVIHQVTTATEVTGTAGAGIIRVPDDIEWGSDAGKVVSTALTCEGITKQGGKAFARIRVGDQVFDPVAVGDVFAQNYKLLSIGNDSSVTILYGDERVTIFAGQSIYW